MKICAVIITFFPDTDFFYRLNSLLFYVDKLVIIDNSASALVHSIYKNLAQNDKIFIKLLKKNIGLASALNFGCRYAKRFFPKWILLLDQDSVVSKSMINQMLLYYANFEKKSLIYFLVPTYRDMRSGLVWKNVAVDTQNDNFSGVKVQHAITSGSLIKPILFDKVGYFEDTYFIDYIDIEFSLRCKRNNISIVQVESAVLTHSLGCMTEHRAFGQKFICTNHSSLRRYYFFRNAILTYRKYCSDNLSWVFRDLCIILKVMLVMVMFESDKLGKVKAFFCGIYDGLVGNRGQCRFRF